MFAGTFHTNGCMFFRFPPDAGWNPDRNTVEFGIGVGEYDGAVRVSRRVFQILLPEDRTPERCLEAYHMHRTRLELIAERKVRRKQLTDDGNVEITGRDLRERSAQERHPRPIGYCRGLLAVGSTRYSHGSMLRFRRVDIEGNAADRPERPSAPA
jgi:hypothetical protein